MALNQIDTQRLREALALAETAIGVSDPNPRVGCIIGFADGRIAGRGATQQAGGPHAEVVALRDAAAAGADVRGATAWVTLEPCAHHGRTPPCCDALIGAGIGRVVAATVDPFPQVAGEGLRRLRGAGIDVALAGGAIAAAARELNIGFFSRIERGRPWVRLKAAASLDGRTALPDGRSQWITGPEARADGHAWRRRAGAVLTGIGTVLADDPRLDVRLVPTRLQPLRVVVDSSGRIPRSAKLLQPPGEALVVTAHAAPAASEALRRLGVKCIDLPAASGGVDLGALIDELARLHVNELHVEAGATLSGAFLRAGLVDELLLYLAPVLLGPGRGIVQWPVLPTLAQAVRLQRMSVVPVGPDLVVRLRTAQGLTFARAASMSVDALDSHSPLESGGS